MPKNVEPLLLWLFAIYITSSMNYSCLLPNFSFFKNWSIVNLQCCVTSKCTAKWFSYTHIYFSTDSFPYRLLQDIEYSFLCYTSPYCLAILYVVNPMDGGAWWAAVHGVAKSRTWLSDFTFIHWRRKWQPTPVFLPGESQGWRGLVGCRLWGRTESDTTEAT